MLPPMKEPKKVLQFPRWAEWVLVAAMLFLAFLEYTHEQNFWAIFFSAGALVLAFSAAGFFGRPTKGDSDGK